MHIRQRGNNRMDCFVAADDRRRYLFLLQELAAKYEAQVHAYCLMTNHVHLLITPASADSCAGMMRELGRRYTRYFNRRYLRSGTLWEGRFKSCLVQSASYVIACYRYIELNPVRPGMASEPAAYPWSSHLANLGTRPDAVITPHPEFLALGLEPHARYRAYAELVRQALDPAYITAIRRATSGGLKL